MADLVVKEDLVALVGDLGELISQFEGALDFQDDFKGIWGQHNADLSMGDFADNWTTNRNKMVDDMKSLREHVIKVNEAWAEADRKLTASMQQ